MSKTRKKSDLPTKVCPTCKLSFTWRKKWEKVWKQVIYCSKKCRSKRITQDPRVSPKKTSY